MLAIKLLYILNFITLLPCVYTAAMSFGIILPGSRSRVINFLMGVIVFMRCFFLPYIVAAVLTVIYIMLLKTRKASGGEVVQFVILLILTLIGLSQVEFLFQAAMGV